MSHSKLLLLGLCFLGILMGGCKKDQEPEPILNNEYVGTMKLDYSRGFPPFNSTSTLNVTMDKDGILTSGESFPAIFQADAILYQGGEPQMKMVQDGTVNFDGADGLFEVINGEDKILIRLHSVIDWVQYIYSYDDEQGFVLAQIDHMKYEDKYEDGTWEFSLDDAVINGSEIIVSYPDIVGEVKYGYTLYLVPVP